MNNFDEFNGMYNEDGTFDFESLGDPDEIHEFEKNGVILIERIWRLKGGREMKHVGLRDVPISGQTMITSEDIHPDDLKETFRFRKTLPLNFLKALQGGAKKYNDTFNIQLFERRKILSTEEKIRRLQEDKILAVQVQDYEGAALILDEIRKLEGKPI